MSKEALKLSNEAIDVGFIVKKLLNPDTSGFNLQEIPERSLYTVGNTAVNFQKHGDTVIMRLVEKQCL